MIKVKKYVLIFFILLFSVLLLIYAKEITASVIKSINTCINVIIPSMFAYMVISSYIISSSLYKTLFYPFYLVLKKIIKLDEQSFSIFLLSLIGGYPVGIKLLCELIAENKNYSAIASKTASFCYCMSPTFAVTMIGLGVFNSIEIGMIVYVSNIISNLIIAIIYTNVTDLKFDIESKKNKSGLIQAINSSSNTLLRICSVIVVFNIGITAVNSFLGIFDFTIPLFVNASLEISNILNSDSISIDYLPVISMLSSTGGVCVLFQCYSIIQGSFSIKRFLILRTPAVVLSGIITCIIMKFYEIPIPSSSFNNNYLFEYNTKNGVVFLLMIMCIILLQKNEKIFKKG